MIRGSSFTGSSPVGTEDGYPPMKHTWTLLGQTGGLRGPEVIGVLLSNVRCVGL